MKHWHWARIKFIKNPKPEQAPAGNWVYFWIAVKNSDPNHPFRETHWSMHTLGM